MIRHLCIVLFAAAMLLSLPSCQTARWDKTEIALETAALTLHMVDWSQTLKIARNPAEYTERNPLLGRHPSEGKVNIFMGVWLIIQPVIANALPHDWRKGFIALTAAVKLGCVLNNANIGLGWGF